MPRDESRAATPIEALRGIVRAAADGRLDSRQVTTMSAPRQPLEPRRGGRRAGAELTPHRATLLSIDRAFRAAARTERTSRETALIAVAEPPWWRTPPLATLRLHTTGGGARARELRARERDWDARACTAGSWDGTSRARGPVGATGRVNAAVPVPVHLRARVPTAGRVNAAVPLPVHSRARMPTAVAARPTIRTFATALQEEVSGAARPLSRALRREAHFVEFVVEAASRTQLGQGMLDAWIHEDFRERSTAVSAKHEAIAAARRSATDEPASVVEADPSSQGCSSVGAHSYRGALCRPSNVGL